MSAFKFGEILLPEPLDVSNWAVVACDQYTSEREYWDKLCDTLIDPTSLNLVFPECYLGMDDAKRIENIRRKQYEYLGSGLFRSVKGTILVKRTTPGGRERYGLMCLVDLDEYDVHPGSKAVIRATEGLVESRIPPRVAIRKDCPLELPHAMLLIDDEERMVIEPLKGRGRVAYDGELCGGGGHVTGYEIEDTSAAEAALSALSGKMKSKYGEELLFLVGDGNHSLATAKACRSAEPLSKYALVEVVNIYDEGIVFEPIHRAVFGVNNDKFLSGLAAAFTGESGTTTVFDGENKREIPFPNDPVTGVERTQNYIDDYLASCGGTVDYVHGDENLARVASEKGAVGIMLRAMDKSTFFRDVIRLGKLPRKTFSMGEAYEKRYYIEARRIKSEDSIK